jgi:hypothetical protein
VLNALAIRQIRRSFPSDAEIRARSKGDGLSKMLTVMQLLWFTAQAIGRHVQGKAVSLLEVAALAFVSMAILSYIFWFKRPQGLSSPFVIYNDTRVQSNLEVELIKGPVPLTKMALVASFVAFGVIHLLAWNYAFPSTAEKQLWRVDSLLLIVLPCIASAHPRFQTEDWFDLLSSRTIIGFFVLARLYLLVEAFLVFRSAPSSIYESVDWSAYFVHF